MKEMQEFEQVKRFTMWLSRGEANCGEHAAVLASDYDALLAYTKELAAALHKIASAEFARSGEICECDDHLHVDCCASADFYCPMCIAGRALLSRKEAQSAK